jgi:hypothetical protein
LGALDGLLVDFGSPLFFPEDDLDIGSNWYQLKRLESTLTRRLLNLLNYVEIREPPVDPYSK